MLQTNSFLTVPLETSFAASLKKLSKRFYRTEILRALASRINLDIEKLEFIHEEQTS